jgi:hypothetical protein
MRALTYSQIAAAAVFVALAACSDPFSTPPNEPSVPGELMVVPSAATIRAGQTVALKAGMRDQFGDALIGVAVTWRSSNEAVATVAATGEVLGRAPGAVTITADAHGKTQRSAVKVLPKLSKNGDGAL